jgi:hypothetical protein
MQYGVRLRFTAKPGFARRLRPPRFQTAGSGKFSMTGSPQKRRSPEEIRKGNIRLGLILFAIVAAFFVGIFVKQCFFA